MSFWDDDVVPKGGDQHAISSFVSNGEVQGKGRTRKVDFLVTTKFANTADSLVRRTWEDFAWIQERLVQERAGIVVPILPIRTPPNKKAEFEPAYTTERQNVLDRFLQRIVAHSELVDAPSLLPFFTANGPDWSATKEAARLVDRAAIEAANDSSVNDTGEEEANTVVISATKDATPQKKKGVLGQWWADKRDQIALRSKTLILEETPMESKRFDDMQSYAEHLETCIRILAEDSKQLGAAQRNTSEKMKTMGAAFAQFWGEHELSNSSSSTMYQTLGDFWANISKRAEHQSSFGAKNLEEPLEELLLDVTALKGALAKRKKVVYEYTKLVRVGRKLQQRFENMQSAANMNQMSDMYFTVEREIRTHDATVEDRRKFKELITDRLSRDIERFRIEWHERMRHVMERYHKEQAQLCLDKLKLWEGALPVLSKVDSSHSALPTGAKKAELTELSVSYTTSGATVSFVNRDNEGDAKSVTDTNPGGPPKDYLDDVPFPDILSSEPEADAGFVTLASLDSGAALEESRAIAPPPAAFPPPPPASPPPVPPSPENIKAEIAAV